VVFYYCYENDTYHYILTAGDVSDAKKVEAKKEIDNLQSTTFNVKEKYVFLSKTNPIVNEYYPIYLAEKFLRFITNTSTFSNGWDGMNDAREISRIQEYQKEFNALKDAKSKELEIEKLNQQIQTLQQEKTNQVERGDYGTKTPELTLIRRQTNL